MKHWVAGAVAVLLAASSSQALVNPHVGDDQSRCLRCHERVITPEEGARGEYHLLEDTIDAVCLRCHLETECCTAGRQHMGLGVTHPSDLEVSRAKRTSRPTRLPVFGGRITCATCHLHDPAKPEDYQLVRMVSITPRGIDWTRLCSDCHTTD